MKRKIKDWNFQDKKSIIPDVRFFFSALAIVCFLGFILSVSGCATTEKTRIKYQNVDCLCEKDARIEMIGDSFICDCEE